MKQLSRLEQMGATPGKLALVAVLAMVLVLVIVRAIPSSNQQASNSPKPKAEQKRENPVQQVQQGLLGEGPAQATAWPKIEMTEMLAGDPFATPSWAEQPEEAQEVVAGADAGKLAELQEQGATLVMITSESKLASIGDRNVHIGDILEGYQITDITAQGIVLHKLSSR